MEWLNSCHKNQGDIVLEGVSRRNKKMPYKNSKKRFAYDWPDTKILCCILFKGWGKFVGGSWKKEGKEGKKRRGGGLG